MKLLLVLPLLCIFVSKNNGQSTDSTSSGFPALDPDWSYCYEFTWFGPDYDNVTRYNGTCSDFLDETRAEGIPCASPIVISYDGTPPDMDYLWENHKASILCRRSRNQVCVKYTYYFNNEVNNITHMCSKVLSVNSNTALTDGCYKQTVGGYDVEACVCRSGRGLHRPCNDSTTTKLSSSLLFFSILYYVLRNVFQRAD